MNGYIAMVINCLRIPICLTCGLRIGWNRSVLAFVALVHSIAEEEEKK